MSVQTTPPIYNRDGEYIYLDINEVIDAVAVANPKPLRVLPGSFCLVRDVYGVITGMRYTAVDANGLTTCNDVPTCVACGTVWYCTPTGPVEVAVGTSPPAGFTGGPWATAAEAAACPVPDVVIPGYGCAPNPLTVPGAVWFNLTAMTGSLGSRLPASVRVALSNPGSGGGLMGSTAIVDRTNPARTYTFSVNLTCLASNYRIELYILPTPTAGTVTLSAGTSPWARNTGGVFWEWFNLTTAFPAGAWPLSAPEPVGTWTDPDAFGTLALVMSR